MGPELTVLMAVHNGGSYLKTAIDSILDQTYRDFRFLIVDDASTDDSREIIRAYDDDRIDLVCLESNVGQTAALNIGLRQVATPWIARMDADDFSAPIRLEEQMRALDQDSSLACVGTFAWIFHDDPRVVERIVTLATDSHDIKQASLAELALIHGCIVVSREALLDVGFYNERFRYCADMDLFDRLLAKYPTSNVAKPLVGVRHHDSNGSNTRRALDENIEIISNRLSKYTTSPEDAAVVSASLSWVYLIRARRWVVERAFLRILPDVWQALWASPKKFPWYSFKVFAIYNVPVQHRATVKRFILRIASGPGRFRQA